MRKYLPLWVGAALFLAGCQVSGLQVAAPASNLGEVKNAGAPGERARVTLDGYLYYKISQRQHYLTKIARMPDGIRCKLIEDGEAVYLAETASMPKSANGHFVRIEGTLIYDRSGDPLDINEFSNFGRLEHWQLKWIGPSCLL